MLVGFNCDFDYADCNYEQRVQIFEQWLSLQKIFYVKSLSHALIQMLFISHNIPCETDSLFTNEQAKQYIKDHPQFIDHLNKFTTSCLLYVTYQLYKKDLIDDFRNQLEHIDDRHYISLNVVNIFKIPELFYYYTTINKQNDLKYFDAQFETNMWNGLDLADYFYNPNNILFGIVSQLTGEFDSCDSQNK